MCPQMKIVVFARESVKIPRLLLENQVRLHEELDSQPQPTRHHAVHLLADAVPQIQPQVLPFAARELQPEVVHFNYAQLSANLGRDTATKVTKLDFGQKKDTNAKKRRVTETGDAPPAPLLPPRT